VDKNIVDYSDRFNSFYDIFVGMQIDYKNFDLPYNVRETRNVYASFVNLLDTNAVVMQQKHQFDKAPLEFGYRDYGIFPSNVLANIGKDLDDLESKVKNGELTKKQLLLQEAAQQHQELQNRYQAQKGKDIEDIVSAAKNIETTQQMQMYYRVIKNKQEVYDIISRSFGKKKGWQELPHGLDLRNSWNFMWSWSKITIDITKLLVF